MRSQEPGSLRDPFGSLEGPVGNSEDPFSRLMGPFTRSEGPLTCLEDRAMRSGEGGGGCSSESSSVLSVDPVGKSFSSKGASGPFIRAQGALSCTQGPSLMRAPSLASAGPSAPKGGPLGFQREAPSIQGPSQIGLPPTRKYLPPSLTPISNAYRRLS